MTKRKARRKRILINWLSRKMYHRHTQFEKFLGMHKILLPESNAAGWEFSEEEGLIDKGGPVHLMRRSKPSRKQEKQQYEEWNDSLTELIACKSIIKRWSTKAPVVQVWPEDMVKLNWEGRLAPWADFRDRVTSLEDL